MQRTGGRQALWQAWRVESGAGGLSHGQSMVGGLSSFMNTGPAAAEAPTMPAETAPRSFRIHACDIQTTHNALFVTGGKSVEQWWNGESGGRKLVAENLQWGKEVVPQRFPAHKIKHTSLTMEESLRAETPTVHLHARFTFKTAIDRENTGSSKFNDVPPLMLKQTALEARM